VSSLGKLNLAKDFKAFCTFSVTWFDAFRPETAAKPNAKPDRQGNS